MVHDELYSLLLRIIHQFRKVKIRIRRNKIENKILTMPEPIFPTDVPSFYQHCIKPILCSKVYVFFYVGSISAVGTIGCCFGKIRDAKLNGREIIGK